jgi:chromosome segregation ATPase
MGLGIDIAQRAVNKKISEAGNISNPAYEGLNQGKLKNTYKQLLNSVKEDINRSLSKSPEVQTIDSLINQLNTVKKDLEGAKKDLKGSDGFIGIGANRPRSGQRPQLEAEIKGYQDQIKNLNNQINQATKALEQRAGSAVADRGTKLFKNAARQVAQEQVSSKKNQLNDKQNQIEGMRAEGTRLANNVRQLNAELEGMKTKGELLGEKYQDSPAYRSLTSQKQRIGAQLDNNLKTSSKLQGEIDKLTRELSANQDILNAAK